MEAAQCLTLAMARHGDELIIRIHGDLDLATVGKLVEAVEAAVDEQVRRCVLDCEEMTFIDSEGIKALLVLRKRYAEVGRALELQRCSRQMRRLLTLLGLQGYLGCPCNDEPKPCM